ncbi:hypothetical protein KY359_01710 [Candidatus Woesearchaeota archaeon]|nr:hypothetical protein [Candidatus Woesearchaeota archaeon]
MTAIVGRQETTLDEVLDKITTAMPQTTEQERDFCRLVGAWYGTLAQVREDSDGHGVSLVIWNGEESGFQRYSKEARPFNGTLHAQDHDDIVQVMAERRHRDAAIVSDEYGEIFGANVPLPLDTDKMRDAYGILPQYQVADFMGCAADEDLGTRAASALWATKRFAEIAIITLGENHEDGSKGPLRVYFNGNMVHSTDGRYLHWDCVRPEMRPADHSDVKPLDRYITQPPERTYCGDGQEMSAAMGVGGPI